MRLNFLYQGLALLGLAVAAPSGLTELELTPREDVVARGQTCNTATNRACWMTSPAFDINTDYETSWPTTGVTTRSYTFTITEVNNWVGGDGQVKQKAMLVNGQFPGPTITADWGDTISVTVINNLVTNGTSIHWHGLRQLNNNINDGVPGITECPIPPNGGSKTYTFVATQYGTSWYHSHFSSQYANGILGPIVINGPASSNYDIDLGPLTVNDWYYQGADAISIRTSNPSTPGIPGFPGSAPPSDNVLFNGVNKNYNGATGSYKKITLTPNKVHLVRLINPSVQDTFTLSLVGHSFTIIAADFVPVTPTTVTSLYMTVGQRYDVLITANQPVNNYWFNVTYSSAPCGISYNPKPAAIFSYTGAAATNPTNPGTAPPDTHCADKTDLVPKVVKSAPSGYTPTGGTTLNVALDLEYAQAKVYWPVNSSPINVSWSNPTLQYVLNGNTGTMPSNENVVSVPTANTWTYWLIQNQAAIPHPMHLHGHDFLILGQSPSPTNPFAPGSQPTPYNPSTDASKLKYTNPTRRDTTVLPAWGWLVVAYYTSNPGAWLFHCHVAWHVAQGLSIQYLEQLSAIPTKMNLNTITPNCNNWKAYYPANDPYPKHDSGI